MRFSSAALVVLLCAAAAPAWADKPPAATDDMPSLPVAAAPGSHRGVDVPVVGTPAPAEGTYITGDLSAVAPSARLSGREAALRFRFQQQLQTGEVPWTLRSWRN